MTEIGRELTPLDLSSGKVVVVKPPGHGDLAITMWVVATDTKSVTFYSGVHRWHVINLIKDGKLVDDRNRQVHVFEYLGKI